MTNARELLKEARDWITGRKVDFNDSLLDRIDAFLAAPEGVEVPVKLDTETQVFFYEQDHYYLSNFSAFRVRFRDVLYDTSEHAYQAQKFFADESVDYPGAMRLRWEISSAPSAHEAFKMAEQNIARRHPRWDASKVGIMRDILRAKVEQHEYVRRKLLQTGDRELIENSWRDDYWGWGPNRDGKNMLGKLWMEIRAELLAARGDRHEKD